VRRLPLEQAIAVSTLEGAYVLGVEAEIGSIEVGEFADKAVLNRNLFEIDPIEIDKMQVLLAIVDGKIVYDYRKQGKVQSISFQAVQGLK
jgi:predicted amidohydrolase YtcJ